MNKTFKVGDKVKVVTQIKAGKNTFNVGEIATVTTASVDLLGLNVTEVEGVDKECLAFTDKLELYVEPKTLKVGDKVKILCDTGARTTIGDIATVFDAGTNGRGMCITTDKRIGLLARAEWLELVEPKKESKTFNVGDRVKAVDVKNLVSKIITVGSTGVVVLGNTCSDDIVNVKWDKDSSIEGCYPYRLELIKAEPYVFCVGDRVKLLQDDDIIDAKAGELATVVDATYQNLLSIKLDVVRQKNKSGYTWLKQSTKLELVVEPKFKVGDKVKMISTKPTYGFSTIKTGDVGIVKRVYKDELAVRFTNHPDWTGLSSEFELYVEPVAPVKPAQEVEKFTILEDKTSTTNAFASGKKTIHIVRDWKIVYNGETTIAIMSVSYDNKPEAVFKAESKPMHGDVYSKKSGKVVAMAKARIKEYEEALRRY